MALTRRNFLKALGVGAVTLIAFPGQLLAAKPKPIVKYKPGSIIAIGGVAGSCKSIWMAYQAMQFASQGKTVLYLDFDASFSYDLVKKLQEENNITVPVGKFTVVQAREIPYNILSKYDVVCFDSISTVPIPHSEKYKSFAEENGTRGAQAKRLMELAHLAQKHNQVYLFSHQIMRTGVGNLSYEVSHMAPQPLLQAETVFMSNNKGELRTVKSRSGAFLNYEIDLKTFFVKKSNMTEV